MVSLIGLLSASCCELGRYYPSGWKNLFPLAALVLQSRETSVSSSPGHAQEIASVPVQFSLASRMPGIKLLTLCVCVLELQ